MRNMLLFCVLSVPLWSVPDTARAQDAIIDVDGLVELCGRWPCVDEVASALDVLVETGAGADEINSQIGLLAGALVRAAGAAPGDAGGYAEALAWLATASTDPTQSAALTEVARLVATGQAGAIDADTPVAASPA